MNSISPPTLATALQYYKAGRLFQAEQLCQQILALQPDNVDALNGLGIISCEIGRFEQGIAYFQQALVFKPDYVSARINLGNFLQQETLIDEAIAQYQKLIELKPDCLEAYLKMGLALFEQGKLDEAIDCYNKILTFQPEHINALYYKGIVLQNNDKLSEAIACYQHLLALQPEHIDAQYNLGIALQNHGKLEEAIDCFSRVLALQPEHANARWNRSLAFLISGDFTRGFADYEYRWQRPDFVKENFSLDNFRQPVWDGENLEGSTILIHGEQGFGDTIQFIRLLPLVKQRGGKVIFGCPLPLIQLLQGTCGIDKLVTQGAFMPNFDVHVALLSLPHILGITLETIPAQVPYLPVPKLKIDLPEIPNTQLKVGIVWGAGKLGDRKRATIASIRSCELNYFLQLLALPEIALYSLQKEIKPADKEFLESLPRVQDLSNQLRNFAHTAAAIAKLDLVITVDTSVAHLAGALAKPVWVLLPFAGDWRWMQKRSDSPWYPTMRLFRQPHPGDWAAVFAEVVTAILDKITSFNKSR